MLPTVLLGKIIPILKRGCHAFFDLCTVVQVKCSCTSEQTIEVEFLDVNHCITAEDDFGFVTKDLVNPRV